MRTLDRWVMERGVNRELTRTSAGFSDTCVNISQHLTHVTLKALPSEQNETNFNKLAIAYLNSPHAGIYLEIILGSSNI